ncbi:MAG: hypothetical protein V1792_18870 [Pseudomonadota bacterium]
MADEAPDLASCYDLVEADSPLEQGDILLECPVFRPPADLKFPLNPEEVNRFEYLPTTVIVLSQSCDIVPNQKKNTVYVVVGYVTGLSKTSYEKDLHGRVRLSSGRIYGLHLLHECRYSPWNGEQLIVSFSNLWTLPLSYLTAYAAYHGRRIRLLSPYREQLSYRFGQYFSRVALPVDLPKIEIPGKEDRTVDYLENADSETRRRVLAHFAAEFPCGRHAPDDPPERPSILDKVLKRLGLRRIRKAVN